MVVPLSLSERVNLIRFGKRGRGGFQSQMRAYYFERSGPMRAQYFERSYLLRGLDSGRVQVLLLPTLVHRP